MSEPRKPAAQPRMPTHAEQKAFIEAHRKEHHPDGGSCSMCCGSGGVAMSEVDNGNSESVMRRCVQDAVLQGVFGTTPTRRAWLKGAGRAAAIAALASVFPLARAEELVMGLSDWAPKKVEKKNLKVGFVPITCSAPLIAAHPLGIYADNGLDVDVIKTAGWAVARDKMLSGEYDASHLLAPMPLAMTMGAGSVAQTFVTPAIQNINGQAIVLANKHKDKRDPKQWKGFTFGVPFEFSMHNFLLRYYVAEHGIDPDHDIQIRVIPPPEMVANLRAGNVDGYLSPDPFNQRAVYDGVGFIHLLTKEIWDGHPCCAFGIGKEFATKHPNTFIALYKSVVEAIVHTAKFENRKEVAEAIHTKNYLNQPLTVVQQVMTGTFADGLGEIRKVPDRINFAPLPAHSMAKWILSQMKRWGYVDKGFSYDAVADEVYLSSDAKKIMDAMGAEPAYDTSSFEIMGKHFDPAKPGAYADSFAIKRN